MTRDRKALSGKGHWHEPEACLLTTSITIQYLSVGWLPMVCLCLPSHFCFVLTFELPTMFLYTVILVGSDFNPNPSTIYDRVYVLISVYL
jgi:hypothetical protein